MGWPEARRGRQMRGRGAARRRARPPRSPGRANTRPRPFPLGVGAPVAVSSAVGTGRPGVASTIQSGPPQPTKPLRSVPVSGASCSRRRRMRVASGHLNEERHALPHLRCGQKDGTGTHAWEDPLHRAEWRRCRGSGSTSGMCSGHASGRGRAGRRSRSVGAASLEGDSAFNDGRARLGT